MKRGSFKGLYDRLVLEVVDVLLSLFITNFLCYFVMLPRYSESLTSRREIKDKKVWKSMLLFILISQKENLVGVLTRLEKKS